MQSELKMNVTLRPTSSHCLQFLFGGDQVGGKVRVEDYIGLDGSMRYGNEISF